MDKIHIVIDKNGRGGESIDKVFATKKDALKRKDDINGYRVETHRVYKEKPWTKEDEMKWANEEYSILAEQERHNFGDN